ncbi:ribonuclease R [Vagococcus acidifermentans]|uniref:Ribonuclease R n=1 Tax=Vagococcus acidifermentans TaxID=564710 RepID=A0A430ATK7_9ENTE|nr:ribonuclease R [Vagococcus acidifermentans]RSU11399.1 ribonuclease R [Vagococcus acidifermentans]
MTQTIKQAVLELLAEGTKKSYAMEQLAEALGLQKGKDFKELVKTVAQMEREQTVEFTGKGKVKLVQPDVQLEGIFRANERGFGFVTIDDEEDDVFIPNDATGYAMDGDKVLIAITRPSNQLEGQAAEGKVMSVVERAASQIVGVFTSFSEEEVEETDLYGYVTLQEKKLNQFKVFVAATGIRPVSGSVVIVEVTHYPEHGYARSLEGIVKKVVGHKDDPGMDILTIVMQHGIPVDFSEEAMRQAEETPDEVLPADLAGRRDLRDKVIVTIDGEDAKDLDDAVRVERLANGNYFLGVYIADVSYYVTENSPLDLDAADRGTSVYLTDRVIPMLPHKLSNGICSLNPQVDRLAMACEMEITQEGTVVSYEIFEAVINSSARMTYTAVNAILEQQDEQTLAEYAELVPMFREMGDLHRILEEMRRRRGAISFEDREAKIIVDEAGHPLDIQLRARGVGERLIESFMLAANETIARHFYRRKLPFIYRIHEQPKEEKMQRFFEFVTNFGILIKGKKEDVTPKELQKVLDSVHGKPEESVINMMMLRSLQQACYSEVATGHYGLAAEDYTHFTSPIRRYPDLTVHRLIREYSREKTVSDKTKAKWQEQIPDIAEHSSIAERRAVDAERDTDTLKKAEFMMDKIDEEFDGVVTSVTKFGLFVELPNTIEGLVHVNTLKDDYYHFIENHLMLVGERTKRSFRIGQKVTVKVVKADPESREIDFNIVASEEVRETPALPKHGKGKRPARSNGADRRNRKASQRKDAKHKNKQKQPFYKEVVKKKKKKKNRK